MQLVLLGLILSLAPNAGAEMGVCAAGVEGAVVFELPKTTVTADRFDPLLASEKGLIVLRNSAWHYVIPRKLITPETVSFLAAVEVDVQVRPGALTDHDLQNPRSDRWLVLRDDFAIFSFQTWKVLRAIDGRRVPSPTGATALPDVSDAELEVLVDRRNGTLAEIVHLLESVHETHIRARFGLARNLMILAERTLSAEEFAVRYLAIVSTLADIGVRDGATITTFLGRQSDDRVRLRPLARAWKLLANVAPDGNRAITVQNVRSAARAMRLHLGLPPIEEGPTITRPPSQTFSEEETQLFHAYLRSKMPSLKFWEDGFVRQGLERAFTDRLGFGKTGKAALAELHALNPLKTDLNQMLYATRSGAPPGAVTFRVARILLLIERYIPDANVDGKPLTNLFQTSRSLLLKEPSLPTPLDVPAPPALVLNDRQSITAPAVLRIREFIYDRRITKSIGYDTPAKRALLIVAGSLYKNRARGELYRNAITDLRITPADNLEWRKGEDLNSVAHGKLKKWWNLIRFLLDEEDAGGPITEENVERTIDTYRKRIK